MSAGSKEPEAKDTTASRQKDDDQTTPFLKFCRWVAPSVRNPENFPHYLIAIFTLGLAIFAFFAWKESREGTRALQGQLTELQRQSALTISQLRPKLTLTIKGPGRPMKLGDKEGWVLTPVWENHGGSEGINFWGWDNARLFTGPAPADFDFLTLGHDAGDVSKTTIAMNDPHLQLSKVITRDEIQSVMDKKSDFVLWGYVEYRESLPGSQFHRIHWCFGVVPTDAGDSWIFAYPLYRAGCNSSD
jgi:hypothetical protein